jgi:hypothetical protein
MRPTVALLSDAASRMTSASNWESERCEGMVFSMAIDTTPPGQDWTTQNSQTTGARVREEPILVFVIIHNQMLIVAEC